MLASSLPAKIQLPFANTGTKNTIPVPSQIGITPGAASYTDGFPPLTFLPLASGGIPPDGGDFNGIFNAITAVQQWQSAGGIFKYDSTFSTAISGYPAGAILLSTDGITRWLNLVDNNTADPDGGSAGGTWLSLNNINGITDVTGLAATNVTLTSTQYKNPIITLAGTLTANIQIIFPTSKQKWILFNNTTGNFTITAKTSAGTGVLVNRNTIAVVYGDGTNIVDTGLTQQSSKILAMGVPSVNAGALTVPIEAMTLDFRSSTITNGAVATLGVPAYSLVIPSGASLGGISTFQQRYAVGYAYNGGTPVAIVGNINGLNIDEATLISPTTISGTSTSAGVWYSASAVSANSPFRIVAIFDATQAVAGTWDSIPTLIRGQGGDGFSLQGFGVGQTLQDLTGSRAAAATYYNTTSKTIWVSIEISYLAATSTSTLQVNGVTLDYFTSTGTPTGLHLMMKAPVPANGSYTLTLVSASIVAWKEMR